MKHKANRINESTTTVSTVGAIHELPLQKDLPEGWVNTNLEDVVDILDRRRVPVNAEDREKRHGTIPYYGATGQVGWIDDYLFDEELVLLGEDGAPFLEPTKQKAYIIRGKSWVNNHAHVLRARNGIPNAYIKYYLDIVDYHKFVSGTTRLKLNQSAMRQIPVPIAPPDQQKLIVAEIEKQFSRLDEAVTALKRIQANLKRYKASVLKAAVEGKLTEQWRKEHPDVEPAVELLKRIPTERRKKWEEDYVNKYVAAHGHAPKDDSWKKKYKEPETPDTSNLPELPKGWLWAKVEQLYDIVGGGTPSTNIPEYWNGKIPWITSADIYDIKDIRPRKQVTKKGIENSATNLVPDKSIIVVTRVGLGKVALTKTPLCFSQDSQALINTSSSLFSEYSVYYLSKAVQVFKHEHRGTTIAGVTKKQLAELPFPVPPLYEQRKIVEEIERRLSVAEGIDTAIETNIIRAQRLRQTILKQAFRGALFHH